MSAAPLAEPVIETRGLTRRFADVVAVDGLDLTVRRGEIFGCLGPNGSGKSTLMRMLLGLLAPSDGEAVVLGCRMPDDAERLRPRVGYMTQQFSLYDDLSTLENLEFSARVFGLPGRRRRERVAAVLEEYGLTRYRKTRAAALSGGWKQRLALAAATVHEPQLLVLDEPTAGVDPQSRRAFWEKLFDLVGAGATIVVSTHYMDEAVRCHRLCVLRYGIRAALGSPKELMQPLSRRVLDLRTPHPEAAIAALRNAPLVASTTQLGDLVHVLLRPNAPSADESAPDLLRFLGAAGFADARAERAEATLEDVFVALLQGERLDAAPNTTGGGDPPERGTSAHGAGAGEDT